MKQQLTITLSHSDAEDLRRALFRSVIDHQAKAAEASRLFYLDRDEDNDYYHYVHAEEKHTAEELETLYNRLSSIIIDAELDSSLAIDF